MSTERRPDCGRLHAARPPATRVIAPVLGLVCDGPFAEARDYAASVFAARGERETLPTLARDLAGR